MKRIRSDSTEGAAAALKNAAMPDLPVPRHVTLSAAALKFWPGILHARARGEWGPVDLVVAAQLAECQALIEQESVTLRSEGTVQQNDRGTLVANPRNGVIQHLAAREMALMRTLLMAGKAAPDPRSLLGPRRAENAARRAREGLQDDELLAR